MNKTILYIGNDFQQRDKVYYYDGHFECIVLCDTGVISSVKAHQNE